MPKISRTSCSPRSRFAIHSQQRKTTEMSQYRDFFTWNYSHLFPLPCRFENFYGTNFEFIKFMISYPMSMICRSFVNRPGKHQRDHGQKILLPLLPNSTSKTPWLAEWKFEDFMLEFARKRGKKRRLQDVILGEIFQRPLTLGVFIRVFLRSLCFVGVPRGSTWVVRLLVRKLQLQCMCHNKLPKMVWMIGKLGSIFTSTPERCCFLMQPEKESYFFDGFFPFGKWHALGGRWC